MGNPRRLFLLCVLAAILVAGAGGATQATTVVGSDPRASNEVTATAIEQRYIDGPNGTVFTLTTFEAADGDRLTVKTHGGIRSDGVGQLTSHEAHFDVGRTYRMPLSPALDQADAEAGSGPLFRVVGGDRSLVELSESGDVISDTIDNTPGNFVLLPYNWAWTLPDNPPVYLINPNALDPIDEVALVQQGFATWEDDPDSSMDWTYGGTTSLDVVVNDGNNTVFWADTPDPADTFLARANTFFSPSSGRAFDTDIMFNNDFNWVDGAAPGAFDVVSVAIHESGHSLGLDHAPNNAAIMYFSLTIGTAKRTLSLGDRGGVATIYPATTTGDASVSGSATFDGGGPVSGVGIDLFTENRASYLTSTTTDTNGNYTITLPGPGCYVITFIAPQDQTFTNASQYLNAPFCATAGQTVTDINAQLITPGSETSVAGQVTTNDGGGPVSGVGIDLFTENRASYLTSTTTDTNGNYTITLPGPGCYVITFIAPQDQTFTNASQYLNAPFCATAGQTVTDINAETTGGASQATLGDSVTNADGSGEPNVEVVLYQAAADGSRGTYLRSAFTDGSGEYRLDVAAGCYVVDFVAPADRTWVATGGQYLQLAACVGAGEANLTLDGVLS